MTRQRELVNRELNGHDKATIISMAVIASAIATLLHEGLGHGVVAWLRGDIPTELTSNHLTAMRADHWVDAAGTLVNLLAGAIALALAGVAGERGNLRYFCWILAALNLLPGAGYFVFSGLFGLGDWHAITRDLPHQGIVRILMTLFGAAFTVWVVRLLAVSVRGFVSNAGEYGTVGRLPYYAAGLFSCAAGALDPLGVKMMLISTIPAAFGGSAGLLWLNSLLPAKRAEQRLVVRRQVWVWLVAVLSGGAYIAVIGRGVTLAR